jgi:indole-3-glycerol phosphate synthase
MSNFLQQVYQTKQQEVRDSKKKLSLTEICQQLKCSFAVKNRDFFLTLKNASQNNQTALICEVKKGSPSAGLICSDFDLTKIVQSYENAGSVCLSILTDKQYFFSDLSFLSMAHQASNLPLLRKDFIIDPYQVYESKLHKADCILLIVALLSDSQLQELEQVAFSLQMSVLIEVHNQQELARAMLLKSRLLGINNRNLQTLKVDLNTSVNLAKMVPQNYLLVAESGIKNKADIDKFKQHNINCFLIGESLMKQKNIKQAVHNLLT